MLRFAGILLSALLFASAANAGADIEKRGGAIYVNSATAAEVEELFRKSGFEEYNKPYGEYPRIYLKSLPADWKSVPENKSKHRTFIRIMLPLVLKINEEITAERTLVEGINDKRENGLPLNDADKKILEEKAVKYDVFTRMQGETGTSLLLDELLKKIDVVPPSIMIATAAAYTDWGNSRLAEKANSLYLEEIWYSDEGLEPLDDKNAGYRYKIYASLEDCIRDHALKINSHINYIYLREARAINRKMNLPPYGAQMTVHLLHDNNMHNIIGLIDYTIAHYKLAETDYFPRLRNAY